MSWKLIITSSICLLFIVEAEPQFFDLFGFPPSLKNTNHGHDYTTRRTKIDTIKTIDGADSQITWKNTTISFVYEGLERDDTKPAKEKRRKPTTVLTPSIFNFNIFPTTPKTVRKATKVSSNRKRNNNSNSDNNDSSRITDSRGNNNDKNGNRRIQLSYDAMANADISRNRQNEFYSRPINKIQDYYYTERPYIEVTTKPYNYNNKVTNDYNYYTTKNPFSNHPGVRPAVIEKGPPITNRPLTRPVTVKPRPYTERPLTNPNKNIPVNADYNTENQRPIQAVTNRPNKVTRRPTTEYTTTVKTYIVNPLPTDAGALVYPHEDEPPEILRGPDEDYMTDAEKRRYIDVAEKMCDKYKSLTTKHIQAIPLLPSPEPVRVNVSQCTPTTVPLVVGGKVVTITEFPHMALLGWIKLEGPGYSWKCGGSLISEQYILTAAHCSYQERDNTVVTGPPRVVQLGSSYLDDAGALVVRVGAVVRHPKYKFPRSYYDVALLKLVQKVTFSEVIKPACLGVPPPVGEPIIATGWGRTELGGDQSLELRSVSLPIWNMARCHELLGTSRRMPDGPSSESQMCAGEERGGKDTCQGDSGGPAQIQDGCVWRVVGVTSLGRSCGAPNTPGLYALVHRAFISAQVFGTQRNNRDSNRSTQRNNHNDKSSTEVYYSNDNQNNGYNNQHNGYNSQHNNQNERSTTERPKNHNYNGYNQNRRTTTTTENYNNEQSFHREPSSFTNQNKRTDNSHGNSKNHRDVDVSSYNNNQNYQNYNSRTDYSNNNNQNNDYTSNNQYSNNNNNKRQNDYSSNNQNKNDYSQIIRDNNNRFGSDYSDNNKKESDSRSNNGDYYGSQNNNRSSSNYNNNNRKFEEGSVWFT